MVTGATTPIGERLVRQLCEDHGIDNVLAVAAEDAMAFEHEKLVYRKVDLGRSRRAHELLFGIAKDLEIEVLVHTSMHRAA